MTTNNPYQNLVDGFARLLTEGEAVSPGGLIPPQRPPGAADIPTALVFAPHPDDEVIIGGLPLRLLREQKLKVINVAVTLGSRAERQAERWQELKNCCDYIGFGLVAARERGLKESTWSHGSSSLSSGPPRSRRSPTFSPSSSLRSSSCRTRTTGIKPTLAPITSYSKRWAGGQALACLVVETEFWGAMDAPNLMVESSAADVADLVAALSLHVGEVARNAYHALAGLDDGQCAPRG